MAYHNGPWFWRFLEAFQLGLIAPEHMPHLPWQHIYNTDDARNQGNKIQY